MPPGTEPHRQVLNPSPAAAKKQRTCLPSDPTGHPPAVASTCPTPKAPTTSMSVVRQTSAHLYKNLDPVLWPTADVQGAASEGSDSQDGDGSEDEEDEDEDDKDGSSSDDDDGQDTHG